MKSLINIISLFALFVLTAGCDKNDLPFKDPTEGFIDTSYSMEELVAMETGDPNHYYTYFCFCNASDHLVSAGLNFGIGHATGEMEPGYKYTGGVFDGSIPPYLTEPGELISSFEPLLWHMEVFYDDYEGRQYERPGMVWERYLGYDEIDFSQRFESKQVRDQSQWIYEEFTPNRARWIYIFTNADYERAKKISEERDKNNL